MLPPGVVPPAGRYPVAARPSSVAAGSCAMATREPGQGRKAAALSGSRRVPQIAWPSHSGDEHLQQPAFPEGCESGRIGTLGKRVWGDSPWVRIPLPPPRQPGGTPMRRGLVGALAAVAALVAGG